MQKINLSIELLKDLEKESKETRMRFYSFLEKLQTDLSLSSGMNKEKMYNTKNGQKIFSLRANEGYRILCHEENEILYILKYANHEPVYDAVYKIDVLSFIENDSITVSSQDTSFSKMLFARVGNDQLKKIGITSDEDIKLIRSIETKADFRKLKENKIISEMLADNLDTVLAGFSFNDMLKDYKERYHKAINLLLENVIEPAISCPELPDSIKKSVLNTKERLTKKESLEEIIYFYYDALDSTKGQEIASTFHKLKLKAFEDYKDEILKISRGY